MKTEKITLNELRTLVKEMLNEEENYNIGESDVEPTSKQLKNAWDNFPVHKYLDKYGFVLGDSISGGNYYGDKLYNKDNSEQDIDGLIKELKNKFKDPNKIVKLSGQKQYAPEIKFYGVGVELNSDLNESDNNYREGKGIKLAKRIVENARKKMKGLTDDEVEDFREYIALSFDLKK